MATILKRIAGPRAFGARFGSGTAGEHAEQHAKMWEKISVFGAIPLVVVLSYLTYLKEVSHHNPPPEYKEYEHLRIRKKNFPFGDGKRTFFHNPERNALPGIGYEKPYEH